MELRVDIPTTLSTVGPSRTFLFEAKDSNTSYLGTVELGISFAEHRVRIIIW